MRIPQIIDPPAIISLALLCLFAYWTAKGRVEIFIGMFLALNHSTRTLVIFGVAHIWLLGGLILLSAAVYWLREGAFKLQGVRHRWIIPWMLLWWLWMLYIFYIFRNFKWTFINWSSNVVLVMPLIFLFATDLRRVRFFALAYVGVAVIGGLSSLDAVLGRHPFTYILQDPSLRSLGWFRNKIPTGNYHFFAMPFMLSVILAWALAEEARRTWQRIFWFAIMAFCCYMVLLASSRNAIVGTAVALAVIGYQYLSLSKERRQILSLLLVVAVLVGAWQFYQIAPDFFLRRDTGQLNAFQVAMKSLQFRAEHDWIPSWERFVASPVWGTGFIWQFAHNIYLGVLVEQGLVGFLFFAGWLVFTAKVAVDVLRDRIPGLFRWQQAMLIVVLAALVMGIAGGGVSSTWHLFWAPLIAWRLHYAEAPAPAPAAEPRLAAPRPRLRRTLAIPDLRFAEIKRDAPDV